MYLSKVLKYKRIEEQLTNSHLIHNIANFKTKLETEVCSNLPSAFWHRKQHIVRLPYVKGFSERIIPTKARPSQMNTELMENCKQEIKLLKNNIISKSKSPWSCTAFYVNKNAEIERGVPRLVINYIPLNDVLEWIRYPIQIGRAHV